MLLKLPHCSSPRHFNPGELPVIPKLNCELRLTESEGSNKSATGSDAGFCTLISRHLSLCMSPTTLTNTAADLSRQKPTYIQHNSNPILHTVSLLEPRVIYASLNLSSTSLSHLSRKYTVFYREHGDPFTASGMPGRHSPTHPRALRAKLDQQSQSSEQSSPFTLYSAYVPRC